MIRWAAQARRRLDSMQARQGRLGRRDFVIHLVLGACSGGAMALAAFLLIAPQVGPPPAFPFQDKFFHAVCFAALAGPAALVLPEKHLGFRLAHMVVLGAGIEVAQSLGLDSRSGSISDFLADRVGIGAALVVGRTIRRRIELPNPP
jgi:hypothetical protein